VEPSRECECKECQKIYITERWRIEDEDDDDDDDDDDS